MLRTTVAAVLRRVPPQPVTGSFILVDEATNETVGAGHDPRAAVVACAGPYDELQRGHRQLLDPGATDPRDLAGDGSPGCTAGVRERGRPTSGHARRTPKRWRGSSSTCASRPGRAVADLAAGTGQAHPTPRADRRRRSSRSSRWRACATAFRGVLPERPDGGGHRRGAPRRRPAALDAVTVAQAFHWFDADRALRRAAPGAAARRAVSASSGTRGTDLVDWVDAAWSIMDRVEKQAPWRDHENWRRLRAGRSARASARIHEATFHHEQQLTREGVVERFRGVSHVAVAPRGRAGGGARRGARRCCRHHPETRGRDTVTIPYRVDAYWCERP